MSLTESPPLAGAALANHGNTSWSDERIAELTRMWEFERMSASQIAAALGGFSHCADGGRSAVIGKAHRLNLETRTRMTRRPEPHRTYKSKPRTYRIPQFLPNRTAEGKEKPAAAVAPEAENIIPAGQRCTLLDLDDTKCHWPIGDPTTPDFFFCGGAIAKGMSYCGYHCSVACTPRNKG